MQADFWHQRWQQQQIGFHQAEVNGYLTQFWPKLVLAPGSTVLVPLCGKSLDLLWLRAQGHRVIGVELSPLAVAAFFEENALIPQIEQRGAFQVSHIDGLSVYCGDFFDLSPVLLPAIDAVFDRAALVALPPELRQAYAAHLNALLSPQAQMLLVAFDYDQQQMAGPPFSVSAEEIATLYAEPRLEQWLSQDILSQEPHFRERGVSRLQETVYRLTW